MAVPKPSIPEIEDRLTAPSFQRNPHPTYHFLRRHAPVYWSDRRGYWLVTSMDLVAEVLGNAADFSSVGFETRRIDQLSDDVAGEAKGVGEHFSTPQLVSSDPPDHTRIRRAFGASFLPRKVAPLEPLIRDAAERILDTANPQRPDIVSDFAEPLPVEVVSEIIGVPRDSRDRIPVVTMDQRVFFGSSSLTAQQAGHFSRTLDEWHVLLTSWMNDRRDAPRDDVLTRAAEMVDEGRISADEAVTTLLHLVIAGNGTTTALISSAVYHILRHREQARLLYENRDLLANAVEEALRYEAPLPTDRRIANREVTLGGQVIEQGDLVMSVLAAANRDPDHFPNPDAFDITRSFKSSHHFAFGRGIHLCLGAPVARLEATIALDTIFDRFGLARLPEDFEPDWHAITTHRGLRTLPIRSAR